jgi:hypothetical protein
MKFAVQTLMFNCDQFILRMIDNCGPFAEKIYIAYSSVPWNKYNDAARSEFINSTDINLLKQSKYFDKIVFIEGTWDSEESQRNVCLNKAKEDGIDYLIIQDADEFYIKEDFAKALEDIQDNPDFDFYKAKFRTFWKNTHYVLTDFNRNLETGFAVFAVNCHKATSFNCARLLDSVNLLQLDIVCFHLSYVLDDKRVWEKINTWAHSSQFNLTSWYRNKWQKWNPLYTRNLHPISPYYWYKAIEYNGPLPSEIVDFECNPPAQIHFSVYSFLYESAFNVVFLLINFVLRVKVKNAFLNKFMIWFKKHGFYQFIKRIFFGE